MAKRSQIENIWICLNHMHKRCCPSQIPENMDEFETHFEYHLDDVEDEDRGEFTSAFKYFESISRQSLDELERQAIFLEENQHPLNQEEYLCDEEDYLKWLKLDHLKIEEASALAIGRKPDFIDKLLDNDENGTLGIRSKHKDVFLAIERSNNAATKEGKIIPAKFLTWVKDSNFDTPEPLKSLIDNKKIIDLLSDTNKKDAALTKEYNTMLKIIIGMAMAKYRYNPNEMKNSASKNIAYSLREKGIPVSVDTVRKYLEKAKEQLPEKF
jgi:hypothetical protein